MGIEDIDFIYQSLMQNNNDLTKVTDIMFSNHQIQ